MSKSVILGGQILHGRDRLGSWLVREIDGWSKTPPVKGESTARPNADGEFDLPIQYGARSLIIKGRVACQSAAAAEIARDQILGLLQGTSRLQVTDVNGKTQWADVKRNGQITADITGPVVRFSIEAKAVDPRKFGKSETFTAAVGAPVDVYHRGNYPATPGAVTGVIVRGSMPGGYTLTVNGWDYAVSVPLVTGLPHRIDYNTGRLRVNGALAQNSIGNTNLTTIPPGPKVAIGLYPATTGTGTAEIEILDTFI
jgi:hypothetical protein